jgi:hypothetical protein
MCVRKLNVSNEALQELGQGEEQRQSASFGHYELRQELSGVPLNLKA